MKTGQVKHILLGRRRLPSATVRLGSILDDISELKIKEIGRFTALSEWNERKISIQNWFHSRTNVCNVGICVVGMRCT